MTAANPQKQPVGVCATCGKSITHPGPDGECVRCLVSFGFLSEEHKQAVGDSKVVPGPLRYAHFEVELNNDGLPTILGSGAMAVTYRARDTVLNSTVALKVISRKLADNPTARARFLREARAAAQIRHPNVARVTHYGEQDGECFYAMQFVDGETLEARVQRGGRLPLALALEVIEQTARGLAAGEACGVIHRDLKPSNVMIESGLLGFSSGYFAMMDCNALLMIGTDFPYRDFFPKQATIVQIDIRGEQLGRRTKVDYGLVGDTKITLQRLLPRLKQDSNDRHLRRSVDHYHKARRTLDELASEGNASHGSHPQFVARQINELAGEDTIFTCDVGTPTIWAARYLTMNGKRRLLGSFIHGSMANAMPQAIGAQLAAKDRQVVAMSGDGGVSMLLGDLLTLHQLNLPVKIVVFRNDALSFVELEMKAGGLLDFGVELKNPDFATLADSAGVLGLKAETAQDVRPMLQKAFKHDGPALVEAVVHRQELSMPPTITAAQAAGFGLFMLKAVLSGRGDEIVDLAKVNLFR